MTFNKPVHELAGFELCQFEVKKRRKKKLGNVHGNSFSTTEKIAKTEMEIKSTVKSLYSAPALIISTHAGRPALLKENGAKKREALKF